MPTLILTFIFILSLGFLYFIHDHYKKAKAIIVDLKKGSFIKVAGLPIPRYLSLKDRDFELDCLPTTLFFTLLLHEDTAFLRHKGFNVKEILRAFKSTLLKGRVRGGSSISQQTAKNLFTDGSIYFFKKGNNLLKRKFIETIATFALERYLSKEEILYLYLSLSCKFLYPIFGLNNVARFLVVKDLKDLKLHEFEPIFCLLPSTTKSILRIRARGIATYDFRTSYEKIVIVKRALLQELLDPIATGFTNHIQNIDALLNNPDLNIFNPLELKDEENVIRDAAVEIHRIEKTLLKLVFKRDILASAKFYFAKWQLALLHMIHPRTGTVEYSLGLKHHQVQKIIELARKNGILGLLSIEEATSFELSLLRSEIELERGRNRSTNELAHNIFFDLLFNLSKSHKPVMMDLNYLELASSNQSNGKRVYDSFNLIVDIVDVDLLMSMVPKDLNVLENRSKGNNAQTVLSGRGITIKVNKTATADFNLLLSRSVEKSFRKTDKSIVYHLLETRDAFFFNAKLKPILDLSSILEALEVLKLGESITVEDLTKACQDKVRVQQDSIVLSKMLSTFLFEEEPLILNNKSEKSLALYLERNSIPYEFGDLIKRLFSLPTN